MSPASYGELMLYNTIFIFSSMLLYNPLQQATSRYFNNFYYQGIDQLKMIESVIVKKSKKNYIYNVIAIILFSIFFVYYKGWTSVFGCIFLLVYCITFSQFTLYITVFNTLKFRILSSWLPLLERILKPLMGSLFIYYFFDSSQFALLGQAVTGVITLLVKLKFDTSSIDKDFKDFMKTIPIRTLFLWVFLSSDRWILEFFTSSKEVGLYSALTQIGYSPLTQIASVTSILIVPYIYDNNSLKTGYTKYHTKVINNGTILFLLFTIILSLLSYFLKDYVFYYLIDKNFNEVAYLLPYVVFSGGIFVTSQFYALKALIKLKPEILVLPSLLTSIFGLLLYLIFGYYFQIKGIVFVNLLSNCFLFTTTYYYCNK